MLTTYRKDYTPPDYLIDSVDLCFDIRESETIVSSQLAVRQIKKVPLVLKGRAMELLSVRVDGQTVGYQVTDEQLEIATLPEKFLLEIETKIKPHENTALEGLYQSKDILCTQCEAHGFSRITYFLDRPDVMAKFRTKIIADKKSYPILLSNGNCTQTEALPEGRHFVVWEDPFKKPCYLFALVAGDLACIEDEFITYSGRKVVLKIFVDKGNEKKCDHAMAALKKSMRWDEKEYGREYDLDIFMIVAVRSFNMGAMENKGLNIFNAKYILAQPETATDQDYLGIESVVAHEYFHNWTGNRVTCRDWFQLSLKEGLTVFRDQQFSSDQGSAAVERIDQVRQLRAVQFPEDAGPLSHPVRPDSYIEMNNFYTATVYEKGAEIIRMMHTLLTPVGFRRGMDLYFERHDGQAVTCDDFVQAMQDANELDLTEFRRWYSQAGTPQLTLNSNYDPEKKKWVLTVTQNTPPLHIPLALGLLTQDGQEILPTRILNIKNRVEIFEFDNILAKPIPSYFRQFSAPIKFTSNETDQDRLVRLAYDTDPFNRWDAGQELLIQMMLRGNIHEDYIHALHYILNDEKLDNALKARLLAIPSENYLTDLMPEIDVDKICAARKLTRKKLAEKLQDDLSHLYHKKSATCAHYRVTSDAIASRSLKNTCLYYLSPRHSQLCLDHYKQSNNMTDALAALQNLAHSDMPEAESAIQNFYQQWQHEPLVIDKWFSLQAMSELPNRLEKVRALMQHPAFSIKNPNQVRAVIGAFCSGNFEQFHALDGSGYQFLVEQVLVLNTLNPQIAARLLTPLTRWQRYLSPRKELMRKALVTIFEAPNLSKDVYEIVSKSLQA
ncbi:MAG: aminopeptidase N [Gammaproteobacteria bacterium]